MLPREVKFLNIWLIKDPESEEKYFRSDFIQYKAADIKLIFIILSYTSKKLYICGYTIHFDIYNYHAPKDI